MKPTILFLFAAAFAAAANAGSFSTIEAIEYANPGKPLLMDLRVPDGDGPFPVILYLHSGAWISELLPQRKLPQPNGLVIEFEQIPNQPTDAPQMSPFQRIPPPSADDAATHAKVLVIDGRLHGLSGGPQILVDGKLPSTNDRPPENFFFIAKSIEGRFLFDFDRAIKIRQINSYTWHAHERSPQVFRLYGADGQAANFIPAPKFGIDPAKVGWRLIADVNTNPAPWPRGITGISLHQKDPAQTIGTYRYLLFLAFPTETHDPQGHTFFSEIDVIEAK